MFRRFLKDVRGNYAMIAAVAMVPIMGGVALAVDYSEMNRQKQAMLNALDAACVATGRRIVEGGSEEQIRTYADDFFNANLGPVDATATTLTLTLPNNATGGGTLECDARLIFKPYFYPAFVAMLKDSEGTEQIKIAAHAEVRLKNTLEVALVLDNSGSMEQLGSGSGEKRIDLLKTAAKQLVDTISAQAAQLKQVDKPVQFALVPFAASVNVGPQHAGASWMDTNGISPIHHENFDWGTFKTTFGDSKKVELVGGVYRKKGAAWGSRENEKVTRFTLYNELRRVAGYNQERQCDSQGRNCRNVDVPIHAALSDWQGCVEARPHPYNVNGAASSSAIPATLFVPMFAPDETDREDGNERPANNNWLRDLTDSSNSDYRQRYMPKYFEPSPASARAMGLNEGPNASCTTTPITPLIDVSTAAGVDAVKDAIDDMEPLGGTNVPEGLAWGWHAVSGAAPFTEGRPDHENGNDKVVIVLTDGENTYYTPNSVTAYPYSGQDWRRGGNDLAGARSIYSSYGYLRPYSTTYSHGRLFLGTSTEISKTDFSNGNYGEALNEHMAALCSNAKASNLIVMTVALDLDPRKEAQREQIEALQACASYSRFRRDEKLFWNTSGGDLAETFKKIADELSNLRIVG